MSYSIVFGNCAGAARGEACDPFRLGKEIGHTLAVQPDTFGEVVAIGLSEVIVSREPGIMRCRWPEPFTLPASTIHTLDDLNNFHHAFKTNCPSGSDGKTLYLSHLNSIDHNHPKAIEGKWNGTHSSSRIKKQFQANHQVFQGTGAIFFKPSDSQLAMQLRPAGSSPDFDAPDDNPLLYHGNRDSEPRTAIALKGFKVTDSLIVDILFCQLETHSNDKRVGDKDILDDSRGSFHRKKQIDKLCQLSGIDSQTSQRPIILMGDFNTRYSQNELDYLTETYGFQHILPHGIAKFKHVDLAKSEEAMGLPFSHLSHRILIDHAFVKGLDMKAWECRSHIIPLADEEKGSRITDHRPIVLTIHPRQ
jgi:hypothetical protein